MLKKIQYNAALFFLFAFLAIISAPTIVMSFDDNIDITECSNLGEEEETEHLKILFDSISEPSEFAHLNLTISHKIEYTLKIYSKPQLNLVLPPPEQVSHT